MVAPTVTVTVVSPRFYTQKDSFIEVPGVVETVGGAGVRGVIAIAVRTDRLNADADVNLSLSFCSNSKQPNDKQEQ